MCGWVCACGSGQPDKRKAPTVVQPKAAAPPAHARKPPAVDHDKPETAKKPPDPNDVRPQDLRRLGPNHVQITRERLIRLLRPRPRSQWGLLIVPNVRKGKPHGMKLFGIKHGSIFDIIGLKNGANVLTIDGAPFNMRTYNDPRLRTMVMSAPVLELEVEYHGQTRTIVIDVKGAPTTKRPPTRPQKWNKVVNVGPNHVRITRWLLEYMLDGATGADMVRLVPAIRNNAPVGYKVFAIRPGSIGAQLGLLNGDTLVRVNGVKLLSPAKRLRKAIQSKKLIVELRRRGKPLKLIIDVVATAR